MPLIAPGERRGRAPPLSVKRPSERRSQSRSAMRALDVLECFGVERRPLRAIEVMRMLGMHASTTDQLLKTMVDSGHLVFDARRKTYLPSPRLIGFSKWLVDSFGADNRLRELVREVHAKTGQVVTLTTPNDLFMQIIDVAPHGMPTERGLRVSLFGSAIGSAHLSTLGSDDVEALADRARIPPADLPAIREAARAIRAAGFADGSSVDGAIWSIAIPLPAQGLQIPLVLGLAGPRAVVVEDRDTLLQLMREAVARWITAGGPAPG